MDSIDVLALLRLRRDDFLGRGSPWSARVHRAASKIESKTAMPRCCIKLQLEDKYTACRRWYAVLQRWFEIQRAVLLQM